MGLKTIEYKWKIKNIKLPTTEYKELFTAIEKNLCKKNYDKIQPNIDERKIGIFQKPEYFTVFLHPLNLDETGYPGWYDRLDITLLCESNTNDKDIKRNIPESAMEVEDIYNIINSELVKYNQPCKSLSKV